MALEKGSLFAAHRIERLLGVGGMGSVYLAEHPRLPRLVALKLLRIEYSSDPRFVERFHRESTMVARLDHTNILPVLDRGSEHGQLWMSMPFVAGTDAEALVRAAPRGIAPDRAVHIVGRVASALDYAHRQQLLHRDVKPANILLASADEEDEREQVFLTDFGIAKSAGEASGLTETGAVIATFDYASPEQIEGKALDQRSDIYALGCVLYQLLTGSVPYPGNSVAMAIHGHLQSPPPAPSRRNPALPAAFDDVVARAMAKSPADRYDSCRELWRAAEEALNAPPGAAGSGVSAVPVVWAELPGRTAGDRPTVAATLEPVDPTAHTEVLRFDHTSRTRLEPAAHRHPPLPPPGDRPTEPAGARRRRSSAPGWLIGGAAAVVVVAVAITIALLVRPSATESSGVPATVPVTGSPVSVSSGSVTGSSSPIPDDTPAPVSAVGVPVPPAELPAVTGEFGERPTITFPATAPPPTLQWQVLSAGSGPAVAAGDMLIAEYVGQLWDGEVFDSSYGAGPTGTFEIGVGAVIRGWDVALVGVPVGSRVLLSIPPADGYGPRGNPGAGIGGTDTLVFVVDVIEAIQ